MSFPLPETFQRQSDLGLTADQTRFAALRELLPKLALAILSGWLLWKSISLDYPFWRRFLTFPRIELVRTTDWFLPTATLKPASLPIPLTPPGSGMPPADFALAVNYAGARDSNALLVWSNGQLLLERYWKPYDATSMTQSQSMHKSLLALAVGVALQQGLIGSLDDPAEQYLPPTWAGAGRGITIRHLLAMSSGLDQEHGNPASPFSLTSRLFMSSDIREVALSIRSVGKPGEKFEYNNVNPQLLVTVLESAARMSYAEFLSSSVWSRVAEREARVWLDHGGGTAHGYCCLMATARDWLRVGVLFATVGSSPSGNVVSPQWIEQVVAPSLANPNYGFLTWIGSPYLSARGYRQRVGGPFAARQTKPFAAADLVFFDGYGGQRVYISRSMRLVIVRTGREVQDWDDAELPNLVVSSLQAAAPVREGPTL